MDVSTVRIRSVAQGGAGVGEPDDGGPVWFIPGALPGEVVTATVERTARRHVHGRLVDVVQASDARVEAPCPSAAVCGGCQWQHVLPAAQLDHKRLILADQLRQVVPAQRVEETIGGRSTAYRRRARMHYAHGPSGFVLGFHRARSPEIVDLSACPVLVPPLDHAFQRIREVADVLPKSGEVVGLCGGRNVVLGLPGVRPSAELQDRLRSILDETLVGVSIRGGRQRADVGEPRLSIDGGAGLCPMTAGPFVFAQANAEINAKLVRHVLGAAKPDGLRVLELYAGAGNLTRALAKTATRVWAVDEDREAIGLLRQMAQAHSLPINAKHSVVERLLPKIAQGTTRYPVAVVDPPRRGLGKEAAAALARIVTDRIVYVSCDPATLARDLRVIVTEGYSIRRVTPLDMMPMTSDVESVTVLQRVEAGG